MSNLALEQQREDGLWYTKAIRYLKANKAQRAALDRGETVLIDDRPTRRKDWAERKALRAMLSGLFIKTDRGLS